PDRPEPGSAAGARDMVLVKGEHRYVFRSQPGEEAAMLARLRDLADNPDVDLSWFDAAVLSHQLGEQIRQRLDLVRPDSTSQ
ncbi:MAG: hypothetical protein ACOCTI_02085, partial [Phycisphaeraceae bacterium]